MYFAYNRDFLISRLVKCVALTWLFIACLAALTPSAHAQKKEAASSSKKEATKQPPRMAGLPMLLEIAEIVTITGGNIERIHYQPGDEVTAGDAIVEIETDRYRYNYEVAKINYENNGDLDAAVAEVAVRSAEYSKAKEDIRRRRITDDDLRRSEAMLAMAEGKKTTVENQLKMRKLALDYAAKELEKRILRAPVDGIIMSISKGLGQRTSPGEVVIRIADRYKVRVSFPVKAELAELMQPGQIVNMRSAVDSLLYQAKVIDITSDPKSGAKTANVAILPSSGLLPNRPPDGEFSLDPDSLNP